MHRQIGQPSLAETLLPETLGRNERLERIGEEVNWERFAMLVEGIYSADEGRPSYPPLMMVKEGTLMDATLVEAQVRRPPLSAGRGAKSSTDPDADWSYTGRGARTHFGYKVHVGVDAGTGLVRKAVLTPAKVYESLVADELVSGDEGAVYGDRAYESRRRRQWLKSQGIKDRIMHRSHKHQRGLPYWQKRRNELIKPRRALVEKVFGTLKRVYGYGRVRYRGLERNGVEMWFKLMAYNMRKVVKLSGCGA